MAAKHPTQRSSSNATPLDSGTQHGRFVPGAMLAGRYRIVARLGEGGMGEVYRADDLELNHSVALKFLPTTVASDPDRLARFRNEVRVARQVSHPNVCRVYDIGMVDGEYFLSMEYVDGEDLASVLRRLGRPSKEKTLEIVRQLCSGLATAHAAGVLHRDLKPANIMIDGRGRVRITDFGLATFSAELRQDDIRIGTPAYMSPEQSAGRSVSVRSDIYSLGLILFELFTGKRYAEVAGPRSMTAHSDTDSVPTSITEFSNEIDPDIARVIDRCIALEPNQRPKSALEVAAALPGGDPLAAALAAGDTPSPELVAAAGDVGTISSVRGLVLVGSIGFGLIALVALCSLRTWRTGEPNPTQLQLPPVVMLEKCSSFLRDTLQVPKPRDFDYGVSSDADSRAYFWYRENAKEELLPISFAVSEGLPSPLSTGSTSLRLDRTGRLQQFTSIPLDFDVTEAAKTEPDWSDLFKFSGLNQGSFANATSHRFNPISEDAREAWTGPDPHHSEAVLRVEAASLRGRPTYFEVAENRVPQPANVPVEQVEGIMTWVSRLAVGLLRLFVFIGAALIAVRNVSLGRGYSRGAMRTGIFVAGGVLVILLIDSTHTIHAEAEGRLVRLVLAHCLWNGGMVATMYLAVEPYVRRTWPSMLTSWTRLISGRWRDPLVGRDILLGMVCGVGLIVFHGFLAVIGGQFSPPVTTYVMADALLTPASSFGVVLEQIVGRAVIDAFVLLFVLVGLLAVLRVRRAVLSGLAIVLFLVVCGLARGGPWAGIVLASAAGAILPVFILARFGLLAMMSYLYVAWLLPNFPLDYGSWYFQRSAAAVSTVVILALIGFVIATRGAVVRRSAA